MPPKLLVDPAEIDLSHIVADREAIRRVNQQRFEMEHLTAIVLVDPVRQLTIGYKDTGADEFWVRGHLPGYPILPGVLMCEAAAQLCSYYIATQNIMGGDFIGFGGMDNVRFRGPGPSRRPPGPGGPDHRINRRQTICNVQGFVGTTMFSMPTLSAYR